MSIQNGTTMSKEGKGEFRSMLIPPLSLLNQLEIAWGVKTLLDWQWENLEEAEEQTTYFNREMEAEPERYAKMTSEKRMEARFESSIRYSDQKRQKEWEKLRRRQYWEIKYRKYLERKAIVQNTEYAAMKPEEQQEWKIQMFYQEIEETAFQNWLLEQNVKL